MGVNAVRRSFLFFFMARHARHGRNLIARKEGCFEPRGSLYRAEERFFVVFGCRYHTKMIVEEVEMWRNFEK